MRRAQLVFSQVDCISRALLLSLALLQYPATRADDLLKVHDTQAQLRGESLSPTSNVKLVFDGLKMNDFTVGSWVLRSDNNYNSYQQVTGPVDIKLYDTTKHETKFEEKPCLDEPEDFERVRPFITNSYRAAKFQNRTCFGKPFRCGRVVLDDVFSEMEIKQAGEIKNTQDLQAHKDFRDKVRAQLEKYFPGVGPLKNVGGQVDVNIGHNVPCQLHTDYLSRPPHYFLTAIVYLSEQGKDCDPCETVFVDQVFATHNRFRKGAIVRPRPGRVALFSGGVENMHCKMPSEGHRHVIQLWFRCDDPDTVKEHRDSPRTHNDGSEHASPALEAADATSQSRLGGTFAGSVVLLLVISVAVTRRLRLPKASISKD